MSRKTDVPVIHDAAPDTEPDTHPPAPWTGFGGLRDAMEARFAKGVLTIRLPKSEAARAAERKIKVSAA